MLLALYICAKGIYIYNIHSNIDFVLVCAARTTPMQIVLNATSGHDSRHLLSLAATSVWFSCSLQVASQKPVTFFVSIQRRCNLLVQVFPLQSSENIQFSFLESPFFSRDDDAGRPCLSHQTVQALEEPDSGQLLFLFFDFLLQVLV